MNIKLQQPSKIKTLISKCGSRLEDLLFSVLLKVPENFLPKSVWPHLEKHIEKRIHQLQLENTKATWKSVQLESVLADIKEKAPIDE